MTLKDEIVRNIKEEFPKAEFEIHEKRDIIVEIRAIIEKEVFIDVYANILTKKRSYSLIYNGERIFGYDNYKFWHYHPIKNPNNHISCEEPSLPFAVKEIRTALNTWMFWHENNKSG